MPSSCKCDSNTSDSSRDEIDTNYSWLIHEEKSKFEIISSIGYLFFLTKEKSAKFSFSSNNPRTISKPIRVHRGQTFININIGYKCHLKKWNSWFWKYDVFYTYYVPVGTLLLELFKRNNPEQKYKEMCLHLPFIPLLHANLLLLVQIP